MTQIIRNRLQEIYPAAQVETTYAAIMERVARYTPPPVPDVPFSERDVVLITYADTLRRAGERPLQTLRHFANKRLQDTISVIHLLPFYPWSSDDGFSVKDFYAVDPDVGTWDDVEALGRGFTLMFDAVFNHMSAESTWFARFLVGDPAYSGLFRTEDPTADLSSVTRPRTSPLLTPFTRADGDTVHVWTTFSADQVDLNYEDPATLLRMLDVLFFYIEKGARIIRLDAIAFLWKQIGTNSIHLPQTHAVIQLIRAVLDATVPDVMIITETNVPHAENISYFGDGHSEAQMVYNFTLPPLLFHTLLSGDSTRLRGWINSLRAPSPRTTFFNFTASHDGIGVRPVEGILSDDEVAAMVAHVSRVGGQVSYKTNPDGSQSPYELNCTYVDAITDPDEPLLAQVGRFIVSQAIALSIAGVPGIYIHSLLGSRNDAAGVARTGRARSINREKLDVGAVEAALDDAETFRSMVFAAYRALLRVRVTQAAFHPNAAMRALDLGNPAVVAIERRAEQQRILTLHNITNDSQVITIPDDYSGLFTDILTGIAIEGRTLTVPPYGVLWMQ